jgi:leucyl/phenylalanyl-tRNA--protein transferase
MSWPVPFVGRSPDAPFPPVSMALRQPNGLLACGGDLSIRRLLNAYAHGAFPWYSANEPILWWSPDPRCVFDTRQMHIPQRLRRWLVRCQWEVSADRNFGAVIDSCAAPRMGHEGTWIMPAMRAAYADLHRHGHAHSVEVRDGYRLVGGVYGVAIGHMFFAESMFSRETNASKVALLGLAMVLRAWNFPLIDAQVSSAHLYTLGARQLPRADFIELTRRQTAIADTVGHWRERFPAFPASAIITRGVLDPDEFASRD